MADLIAIILDSYRQAQAVRREFVMMAREHRIDWRLSSEP